MQSEPGRYINSVSDLLYSPDEIEFLLDDIKDLEPTSFKPEEIQDFEIAGSRTGALSNAECGTADGCECDESPLDGTVNSWDSHSHYRRRAPSPDLSLYSGVILYCDYAHLKTPTGFLRLLLLATTIACLTCLCTSGTVKVGLFMLPLVGRIRLMMFVTLLSLFVTCLLLFLDISHTVYLFPFNWGKINAYLYVSLSVLFLVASSLIFHMIFLSEAFSWVPRWTHHQLLVTGSLGYVCCIESAIICAIQQCRTRIYEPVGEDPSLNLQERHPSPDATPTHKAVAAATTSNQITAHNYKPIVNTQQQQQQQQQIVIVATAASTSRKQITVNVDDVQPCSSKSSEPYRVA